MTRCRHQHRPQQMMVARTVATTDLKKALEKVPACLAWEAVAVRHRGSGSLAKLQMVFAPSVLYAWRQQQSSPPRPRLVEEELLDL